MGTPNIDCLLYDLFHEHFEMIKPPEHINFFNSETLRFLLVNAGLYPIKIYTENPIWVDYNLFNYGFLSLLRRFHILQYAKRKINPSIKYTIATPTGITRKNRALYLARKTIDYSSRMLALFSYPFLKFLERRNKGLILFGIGKKL